MNTGSNRVAVIGQGYVGLPLAIAANNAGFEVLGIDSDTERISKLSSGKSPTEDVSSAQISKALGNGYSVSKSISDVNGCGIVIFCLPTPLDSESKPDLSILYSAIKDAAAHISAGTLVIVESTIAPGAMREEIYPLVSQNCGHSDFELAYSPERIDPKSAKWNVSNTPKLVAGLSENATKRAKDFYAKFVDDIRIFASVEVVETAKLLENSFRLVNISFINEISILCSKLGIDVMEVIEAASSKPYGFMPFYPSAGVGGHCIPVDPMYLADKAQEVGAPLKSIEVAHQINESMPAFYVGRCVEILGNLSGKKILVVGLAYKSNVSDVREGASEKLIGLLRKGGAMVSWHDEIVRVWNNEKSSALSGEFDLAILVTIHDGVDLSLLAKTPVLNTFGGRK
jgi:UDP-N-acetyl-D-glucosamine dehydrogenase